MRLFFPVAALVFGLALGAVPAHAQTPMSGMLTATEACPATTSIHTSANPGDAKLTVGTKYDILGGNKANPTHYWIGVPGADPSHRWVAVTCGTADLTEANNPPTDNGNGNTTGDIGTPTGKTGSAA